MSGGGTKSTSTTVNTADPKFTAAMGGIMDSAKGLYDQGTGLQTDFQSQIVPFSNQSVQGMGAQEQLSQGFGMDAAKPFQNFSGMMDYWNPIAKGDFSSSPEFMKQLQIGQDAARDSVNLSMSGSGRYGSALHTNALGKTIGDFTNKAMLDQQGMANQQLQSYGAAMPGAFQTAMMPGDQLMKIGGNYENLAANTLNDQARISDAKRLQDWEQLARYSGIVGGGGQLGGTQTTTAQAPGTNWGQTALGYGLYGLGSLFGM